MTVLREFERLEATGLWRATPEAQRRDVVVSLGDATLVITDLKDQALAHWSLAAVARANPDETPAIYHPDGDPDETLELPAEEQAMIDAIERVRGAIERARPKPGRLRLGLLLSSVAVVAALGFFWLPDAMLRHAVSVVPQVKRNEIGALLLTRIERVTGPPCFSVPAGPALSRLSQRILGPEQRTSLVVVRSGVSETVHLPGGTILLNRSLVEDHEDPDVVAGYVLAEKLRAEETDPLERLLRWSGVISTFRLMTTGALKSSTLDSYAEALLTAPPDPLDDDTLLRGFADVQVRAAPYAYAKDISGETTLGLIEADLFADTAPVPVLSDGDWVRLQGICES